MRPLSRRPPFFPRPKNGVDSLRLSTRQATSPAAPTSSGATSTRMRPSFLFQTEATPSLLLSGISLSPSEADRPSSHTPTQPSPSTTLSSRLTHFSSCSRRAETHTGPPTSTMGRAGRSSSRGRSGSARAQRERCGGGARVGRFLSLPLSLLSASFSPFFAGWS